MRITGGIARGRRLSAPRGRDTRPTSDKVREAIFDRLGPAVDGAVVLDLFAGTGALALDALSRGARVAVLVDRDPAAVASCRANVAAVRERPADARIVRADAFSFLRRGHADLRADIVLLDPPYAFDRWDELFSAIAGCGAVRPGGMVVRERAARSDPGVPEGWTVERSARYGDTTVDFLVARGASEGAGMKRESERIAIYPGSFDPITNGHVGLIQRSLKCFDRLIVAAAQNVRKETLFSVPERLEMIRAAVNDDPRIEVVAFEGLLVNYARTRGIRVVLRGLRAVADFEYELQMANMNRKLWPEIETFFMMTEEHYFFVSSRNVKEIASLGGSVEHLVPAAAAKALRAKFASGTGDKP